MLVGNETQMLLMMMNVLPCFSSCKALYIDHDNLIPYKINEKQFAEFYKPQELNIEDLTILGILLC